MLLPCCAACQSGILTPTALVMFQHLSMRCHYASEAGSYRCAVLC